MMLSNLVFGFLKRIIDSKEPIDEIINSYKYSERFFNYHGFSGDA